MKQSKKEFKEYIEIQNRIRAVLKKHIKKYDYSSIKIHTAAMLAVVKDILLMDIRIGLLEKTNLKPLLNTISKHINKELKEKTK